MKHLIVYTHPNPNSFNKAIVDTIEGASNSKGHETKICDLYAEDFYPVLKPSDIEAFQSGNIPEDIKAQQDKIKWAEVITFVYPIWWAGMPAMLKGYIDKVFSYGFAYQYTEEGPMGLLKGKKVMVFNTTGTPNEVYSEMGMHAAIEQITDMGIFKFCNIEMISHTFFGAVPQVDDETRKGYLKEVESIISKNL
ncbi:NAD(P)H-dependent oxidoreductase [Wukongibacter baidiensis]|uniref:NAD(P)H-dependent oxidoreductase n=1 Tax=Wukongibacter baidiensis TaxID=1723361 RepID=UPI003D7FD0B1